MEDSSLDDYSRPLKAFRALRTERRALREQSVFAGEKFRVQKKLFNYFVLITKESDRKQNV